MADFMIDSFKDLCLALTNSGYATLPVRAYVAGGPDHDKFVVMRHDVDENTGNALKMARLERTLGVTSTYYFRYPYTFDPEVIKQIRDLGHEVGYHYEVLSKSNGDHKQAIRQFAYELAKFREVCTVETICMHGSLLSPYDNRDLWKRYDFKEYGIIGEAYLSFGNDVLYFSDTGQTWCWTHKIRDFLGSPEERAVVNSTPHLIKLIKSNKYNGLYILTHPGNWAYNEMEWCLNRMENRAINIGKRALMAVKR